MMKRLALILAMAVAAATAQASVLFWQVHDVYDVARGNKIAFDYLTIKNADTGEMLYFYEGTIKGSNQEWLSDDGDPYSASNLVSGDFTYNGSESSIKSFLVQLYDEHDNRVAWQYYNANDLSDHILDNAGDAFDAFSEGGSGGKAYPAVFSAMIPEPSSGMLMLFGLAALALRRRRVKAFAAVAVAAAVLAPSAGFGVEPPVTVTFKTTGPDCYADNTTVLDGECYALVWSPDADTQPVFYADGTVENGKIVRCGPFAKGGRCPKSKFEVSHDEYEELKDGHLSVYLLDTRRWNEDGTVSVSGFSGSAVICNNAAVGLGSVVSSNLESISTVKVNSSITTDTVTALPEDAPTPVITDISIEEGQVVITATNTASYIQYSLKSGDKPSSVTKAAGNPRSGLEDRETSVTFTVPASEGGAFFKVGRR